MLLASFVQKSQLKFALDKISTSVNIDESQIKIYEIDKQELLFVYSIENYGNIEFNTIWKSTISLHCKKSFGVLFSINALNELIIQSNHGRLDSSFEVDWAKYANSLIILRSGKLHIIPIKEVVIFK